MFPRLVLPAPLLALVLMLTACGGGSAPAGDAATQPAATSPVRRQALAAADAARIVYPTDLFNWAERQYPQLLPSHEPNQQWDAYTYRFYPGSQNYLGLADGQVFALGPVSQGVLMPLGPASQFHCFVYADECSRPPITLGNEAQATMMAARTANALFVYDALAHTLMSELFDALALQPVGSGTPPPIAAEVVLPCASGGAGTLRFVDADRSGTLTIGDVLQASTTKCVLDKGLGPEFTGTVEIRVIGGDRTENYLQTDASGAIDLQMRFTNVQTRFGLINGHYRRDSYFRDDRVTHGASSHFDELVVSAAGGATIRFTDVHLSFPGEQALALASGGITVTTAELGAVRNEISLPAAPAVDATTLRYRPLSGTLRLAGTGYWLDLSFQADRSATLRVDNGRDGVHEYTLGTSETLLDALLRVN